MLLTISIGKITFRISDIYKDIQQYPSENDEEKSSLHVERLHNKVIVIATCFLFETCTSKNSSNSVESIYEKQVVSVILLFLKSFNNACIRKFLRGYI